MSALSVEEIIENSNYISVIPGDLANKLSCNIPYLEQWLVQSVSQAYELGLPLIEASLSDPRRYRPDLLVNRAPYYLRLRIRFLMDNHDVNYACTAAQGHFTDRRIINADGGPYVGLTWSVCNNELDKLPLAVWGATDFTQYRRMTPRFMKFLIRNRQYAKVQSCQLTNDRNEFVQGIRVVQGSIVSHEWMPNEMWQYYLAVPWHGLTLNSWTHIGKQKLKQLMTPFHYDQYLHAVELMLTGMDYFKVLDGTTEPTL